MEDYEIIIVNVIVFVCVLGASLLLSRIFPGRIAKSSAYREDTASTEIRKNFKAFMISCYVVGLSLLIDSLDILAEKFLGSEHMPGFKDMHESLKAEEAYLAAWVLFWAVAGVSHLAEAYARTLYRRKNNLFPLSPLLTNIARISLLFVSVVWICRYILDWHVTHILVSTTVVMAALGYGLNGTIDNFMAGVSLHLSRSILSSQWISIPEMDIEGEVISTNWRETRLRTVGGHVYVIPNSVMASNVFHNMSWPDSVRRHDISFIVNFENSSDEVKKAALDAVSSINGIIREPDPPMAIISEFLEFGVKYGLSFWSDSYYAPEILEDTVFNAVLEELNGRGIKFPNYDDIP